MKKLLAIFTTLAMFAFAACEEDKGNDNVEPGGEPTESFIRLGKESISLKPDGESTKLRIYSSGAWSVSTDNDWCSISATSGQGNSMDGEVVTISADMTYEDRSATFVFRCDDKEKTLEVSQKQKNTIASDGETNFEVSYEGGTLTLPFMTNTEYQVVIPSEAQGWISQESGTRALESDSILLSIAANNGVPRSAVVKVVTHPTPESFVNYTITQQGGPNRFLTYTTNDGNVVELTDSEFSAEFFENILSHTYENGVGSIEFSTPITEIPYKVLFGCTTLTSVTLPESVTKIGSYAFQDCSNLTTITYPESITEIGRSAFSGCSSLESFTIPKGITAIERETFKGCSSITNFDIPNGVTKIDVAAFDGCSGLENITIPESVTDLRIAFKNCTGTLTVNCPIPDGYYKHSSLGNNTSVTTWSGAFISSKFTSVIVGNNVPAIGALAFYGCNTIESVTLGNSVTSIEERAFLGCSKLANINIPDSLTEIGELAFSGCGSLTSSIHFPDGMTKIGNSAFVSCGITSIHIPDSVTEIGESAFQYCIGLEIATIGNGVTSIGVRAFQSCSGLTSITIPDSVTSIGISAFNGCYSLTSIHIPDSVTEIGDSAFNSCTSLTSITIPKSVTEVGASAFESCTGELTIYSHALVEANTVANSNWLSGSKFTTLTIGEGITHLGDYVFHRYETVENYNLPESLTTIGTKAISYNEKVASLTIPKNVTEIAPDAFSCSRFNKLILDCNLTGHFDAWCTEVILNGDITEISDKAFISCSTLKIINIPDSVTKIGNEAFRGCLNIENITIPESVTTIGNYAFYNCDAFTSITIPESVTTIGECAFAYCDNLKEFYIKPTTPPSLGDAALRLGTSLYTIYVPTASLEAYLADPVWSGHKWNIKGYDFE